MKIAFAALCATSAFAAKLIESATGVTAYVAIPQDKDQAVLNDFYF